MRYETKLARGIPWIHLIPAIGIAIAVLMLALGARAQTNTGWTKSAQTNTDYFVGTVPYGSPSAGTIQAAATAACANTTYNHKGRVVIPVGVTATTSPTAATGCAGVSILDESVLPWVCYAWGVSGPYTAAASGCAGGGGGGGTPCTTTAYGFQFNNAGSFGCGGMLTTDVNLKQLYGTFRSVNATGADQADAKTWNCYPSSVPGLIQSNLAGGACDYTVVRAFMPGWNLGNPGGTPAGSGSGWWNYTGSTWDMTIRSAGTKAGLTHIVRCYGIGDCNEPDFHSFVRMAGTEYSAEGASAQQKIDEAAPPSGTITVGGSKATTIQVSPAGDNHGIGEYIIDQTYDVGNFTITSTADHSTYGTFGISGGTVTPSVICSTVLTGVGVPALEEGTYQSKQITVNTTVDLTSSINVNLLANAMPYPQSEYITAADAYNSGAHTQRLTLNLNKSIDDGSRYCVGGRASGGLQINKTIVGSTRYLYYIIGSPTSTSIDFTFPAGSNGPQGATFANVSDTITVYHMATVVGLSESVLDAGINTLKLTDNDGRWSTTGGSNTFLSPNAVNQIYAYSNSSISTSDPMAIINGFTLTLNAPVYQTARQFQVSNITPSYYYRTFSSLCPNGNPLCGTTNAPNGLQMSGVGGNGIYYDAAPESGGFPGGFNGTQAAAISMGAFAAGSSTTKWNLACYRDNGDCLFYEPSTRTWQIVQGGGFFAELCNAHNYTSVCPPGGFTNPMSALGDTIYGGAAGVATRLAGFTVAGTYALCETPTGVAVAPTWCNMPITKAVVANNFLTGYSSVTGLFTAAQPAFTDISGQATLGQLPTLAANTVLGALTTTTPSALAVPSCSTAASALRWTSGTGFGCNTAVDAATLLTGTWATPGTIGSGTPNSGAFTTLTASTPMGVASGGTGAATFGANRWFGNNTGGTAAPGANLIGASDWSPNAYIAGAGSVNVMTATLVPAATALVAGLRVQVLPNLANTTTTPTLNVNGLGAKTITKNGTAALAAGDYTTTAIADFEYDGTEFQLLNPQTSSGGGGVSSFTGDGTFASNSASTGAVTLTLATAAAHKFWGNNTASTAAPGYQSIGTNDWGPGSYVAGAGSVNVMTATLSPVATAYTAGMVVTVLPNLANTTTTPTLNVSGLGAKNITKCGTTAVIASDYTTTSLAQFVYDGTQFQLLNPQQGGCIKGVTGTFFVNGTSNVQSTGIYVAAAGGWFVNTGTSPGVVGNVSSSGVETIGLAVLNGNTTANSAVNVTWWMDNASFALKNAAQIAAVPSVFTAGSEAADMVGRTIKAGTSTEQWRSKSTGDFVVAAAVISTLGQETATATLGTGVTSATCQTATCTLQRGSYTVVGGTATTGTIVSLAWGTTTTAWVCTVDMNGGTGFLGVGNSVATTTGMNVTAAVTVIGTTFTFNYSCQP